MDSGVSEEPLDTFYLNLDTRGIMFYLSSRQACALAIYQCDQRE